MARTTQRKIYKRDSNQLFNYIAFCYLSSAQKAIEQILATNLVTKQDKELYRILVNIKYTTKYSPNHPYHNDYRDLLLAMQRFVQHRQITKPDTSTEQQQALDDIMLALYENDNKALKIGHKWIDKHVRHFYSEQSDYLSNSKVKQVIKQAGSVSKDSAPANFTNPQANGNAANNLNSVVGANFQPMILGSIPTVRQYKYQSINHYPKEIRIGTQAEVVNDKFRVNPLFSEYLKVKAKKTDKKYAHVYFNDLRRGGGAYERQREGKYTDALHGLENPNDSKIAVITLPADGNLLAKPNIYDNKTKLALHLAVDEIKKTALHNGQDFYISEDVRQLIGLDESKIEELLVDSMTFMGLMNPKGENEAITITPAQRHALMFHFVKYELTNYIIEQLNPDIINFSCKDAIDRGGAHSLYYNFIKAYNCGTPLSQQEFIEALHAAPTIVKGRGMNDNIDMIWNVFDKGAIKNFKDPDTLAWLEKWLAINPPKKSSKIKTQEQDGFIYDYRDKAARKHFDTNYSGGWLTSLKAFFTLLFFRLSSKISNLFSYLIVDKKITANKDKLLPSQTQNKKDGYSGSSSSDDDLAPPVKKTIRHMGPVTHQKQLSPTTSQAYTIKVDIY